MVMLIIFWDSQGVRLANFQKRGENVNSALHCKVLFKLRDAICRKFPVSLARGALLHHDNASLISPSNPGENSELQWKLEHSPCSPDLVLSYYHQFVELKYLLGGKRFADDEEVETEARNWLR
jgi:hypothetical protein